MHSFSVGLVLQDCLVSHIAALQPSNTVVLSAGTASFISDWSARLYWATEYLLVVLSTFVLSSATFMH